MTQVALQFTKIFIWTEKENMPPEMWSRTKGQKSSFFLEWTIQERMMRGNGEI